MISEKVTDLIGKAGDALIMDIERGAIRKYADAVDDHNPLYWDDDCARNSRYGGIVAPPGFFGWPTKWLGGLPTYYKLREELVDALTQEGYGRVLDGGIEYDFFLSIRVGDTLAALPRIKSISGRETKAGKMVLSLIETTYTNQNGDLVAKAHQTLIHR